MDQDFQVFIFYRSLGLWWCREESGGLAGFYQKQDGCSEDLVHGPFMDLEDALDQVDIGIWDEVQINGC